MNPKRTTSRRYVACLLLLSGVLVLGIVQWSFLPILIQNGPVGEHGRSGNVRRPLVEICGSVQMSVRRWAEAVPCAIEDHRAEDCVQNSSSAGGPDFRPG